ncbi:MAG: anti-sigma factor family protein [Steroidobacteraceae bacterium]
MDAWRSGAGCSRRKSTVGISDELLGAYVDGELSDSDRALVEEAMTNDVVMAMRVQRQQLLRASLQEAYEGVLEEPIPEPLLQAALLLRPSINSSRAQCRPVPRFALV